MDNTKRKKASGVAEYAKTILLVVLFVSVIVLSGMYIVTLNRSGIVSRDNVSRDDITFEKLWTVQDDAGSENVLSGIVMPQFMGFKTAEQRSPVGVSVGEKYLKELYKKAGLYLYYAFGNGADIRKIPDAESEMFWLSLIHSDDYIYIRYHQAIPHQLIQASGGDSAGMGYSEYNRTEGSIVYVKDLFILPLSGVEGASDESESHSYEIAVRDSDDSVYIFTPQKKLSDGEESGAAAYPYPGIDFALNEVVRILITAYGEGMQGYHFAYSNGDDRAVYADKLTTVTEMGIPLRKISAEKNGGRLIYSNAGNFEQIVRIFNFNPDKINTYSEAKNTNIYVETHGSLKIAEDRLTYTARNGVGIPMSDFIGYSHSGSDGDIYDMVRAAQKFIESVRNINANYVGKDADMYISGVYKKDDKIVIEYSYYLDNVKIELDEKEYALSIESDGYNITHVDLFTLSVDAAAADTTLSYTQKWAIKRHLSDRISEGGENEQIRVNDVRLVYSAISGEDYILPNWRISLNAESAEN